MSNPQTEPVVLTERRCRYCRERYRAPRGERRHACPACAPTLQDAIDAAEREREMPTLPQPVPYNTIPF